MPSQRPLHNCAACVSLRLRTPPPPPVCSIHPARHRLLSPLSGLSPECMFFVMMYDEDWLRSEFMGQVKCSLGQLMEGVENPSKPSPPTWCVPACGHQHGPCACACFWCLAASGSSPLARMLVCARKSLCHVCVCVCARVLCPLSMHVCMCVCTCVCVCVCVQVCV